MVHSSPDSGTATAVNMERHIMGDRYFVATRSDGLKTWHVVVDGPATPHPIHPRQIVMEFRDRSKAETHAAMLNGKRAPSN
jgi:hypothetical protein